MIDVVAKDTEVVVSLPDPNGHLEDQAKFFDAHPEAITPEYLNNLITKLPGAHERSILLEFFPDKKFTAIDDFSSQYYSPIKREQTVREFIQSVDRAISRAELDLTELSQKVKTLEMAKGESWMSYRDELSKEIIPIYHELRRAGYNHLDIVK